MAKKDAARSSRKWAKRMAESGEDYKAGVMAQDVAPTQLAKAKKDSMRQRTMEAIDNGDWERGLDKVSLQDWQQAASQKGAARLVDGARQAESKVNSYQAAMRSEYDRIRETIRAMPNATEADRTQRMLKNVEMMKALKGRGSRRG